ncbi:hypothetical protein CYMTET_53234 [Cymbomonas tetramitiformis]|uniref:JmjC domain-containing protein n=1 Tax=Cymbomonas tetramitiformis TaxID=36881 RepID=A0AAE0EQ94_9CHLO|nr:hypothetical protein CYMTET_53234 [Cymbomonas tetramitiformis]
MADVLKFFRSVVEDKNKQIVQSVNYLNTIPENAVNFHKLFDVYSAQPALMRITDAWKDQVDAFLGANVDARAARLAALLQESLLRPLRLRYHPRSATSSCPQCSARAPPHSATNVTYDSGVDVAQCSGQICPLPEVVTQEEMLCSQMNAELDLCSTSPGVDLLYFQWRGLPVESPAQGEEGSRKRPRPLTSSVDEEVDEDPSRRARQKQGLEGVPSVEDGRQDNGAEGGGEPDLKEFIALLSAAALPRFVDQARVKQCNVWWGLNVTSRLHFDGMDNLYIVLYGCKTFHLYPPFDDTILPEPWKAEGLNNKARLGTTLEPNEGSTVPPCDGQRGQLHVAKVGPNEALVIPSGWWHEVITVDEPCFAVNVFLTAMRVQPSHWGLLETTITWTTTEREVERSADADLLEIIMDLREQVKETAQHVKTLSNRVNGKDFIPRAEKPMAIRHGNRGYMTGAGPLGEGGRNWSQGVSNYKFQQAIDNDDNERFRALCLLAGGKPEIVSHFSACSFAVGEDIDDDVGEYTR